MNINGTPNICVATLKLARYRRKLQQETNKTQKKTKKKNKNKKNPGTAKTCAEINGDVRDKRTRHAGLI